MAKCPGDIDARRLEDMTFEIAHPEYQNEVQTKDFGYKEIKSIDTQTFDTIITNMAGGKYTISSIDNVKLVQGFHNGGSFRCDCDQWKSGVWIEKYRSGVQKSVGSYFCDQKIGTWTYYYKNGNISKVENYSQVYPKTDNWRPILRNGPYSEYHENGNVKMDGNFEIFEKYVSQDTTTVIDYDTYEESQVITKGDFWVPASLKSGIWRTFDESGKLLDVELIYPHQEIVRIRKINLLRQN